MRFLIDECLSARIAPMLAAAGHDAAHVGDRHLQGHPDREVLELARAERRVLISADTDFGEILAGSGAVLPSLILFRQGNRAPEHRVAVLLENLAQIAEDIEAGAIVVFTDDRIRIRRLPIR